MIIFDIVNWLNVFMKICNLMLFGDYYCFCCWNKIMNKVVVIYFINFIGRDMRSFWRVWIKRLLDISGIRVCVDIILVFIIKFFL